MDCTEKCQSFDFITSLLGQHHPETLSSMADKDCDADSGADSSLSSNADINDDSTPTSPGYVRPVTNYFAITAQLRTGDQDLIPLPIRTFTINNNTAIHLTYSPSIWWITINDAAEKFGLPDLCPALADFLNKEAAIGPYALHTIGGQRRTLNNCPLPFTELQVWFKVWVQNTEFHDPNTILPVQTLFCAPPDRHSNWTFGHYDTAIINHDVVFKWPESGLKGLCSTTTLLFFSHHTAYCSGHSIGQLQLIFRPLGQKGAEWLWTVRFLVYAYFFNTTGRDATQLNVLKKAKCANNQCLGNVVPLSQIHAFVHLIPRFRETADC